MELEHYGREPVGIQLIQLEIEAGDDTVNLGCTPRRLLSPAAVEAILADREKQTTSVKITVMSAEYMDKVIKNGFCLAVNTN